MHVPGESNWWYEYMSVFGIATSSCVIRGGFRGGRAGRAPPLKFAKHMLYNVN